MQALAFYESLPFATMVLGGGVYQINALMEAPRLVAAPPAGEEILQMSNVADYPGLAAADSSPTAGIVVTTSKRIYVVDSRGAVRFSAAHPAEDAGRTVQLVRAGDAGDRRTLLWYRPRRASRGDTLNHVVEITDRTGAVAAERRFGGVVWDGIIKADDEVPLPGLHVPPVTPLRVLPAFEAWYAARDEEREVGRVVGALLIGALSAVFTWWLCRRYAFARGRTVTWTALSAAIGPIAPIMMWLLLEWPAREAPTSADLLVRRRGTSPNAKGVRARTAVSADGDISGFVEG